MWKRLTCTAAGGPALDRDAVKAHLNVAGSDDDDLIDGLMAAAQALVEGPTGIGVALKPSTWTLSLDRFPASVIDLELAPVVGVTSVVYVDADGAPRTLAADNDYQVDLAGRPARLAPAVGKTWPATRQQLAAVTITFTAGDDTVPQDLVQAMHLIIGHWYANRETVGEYTLAELPFAARALLGNRRNLAL